MFKKRKFLNKCKEYVKNWDTEMYGFVVIQTNGKLIRTNNKDKGEVTLDKVEFVKFMEIIGRNT